MLYPHDLSMVVPENVVPPGLIDDPELMLLQLQRDNLVRQNQRLVREIAELTHRIQADIARKARTGQLVRAGAGIQ